MASDHHFSYDSFHANDLLYRFLADIPLQTSNNPVVFPNHDVIEYSPPAFSENNSVCHVGHLYFFDLLKVVGRTHSFGPQVKKINWSDTADKKIEDKKIETLDPKDHRTIVQYDKSVGSFDFDNGEDQKIETGSIRLDFYCSPAVLSLFDYHQVYSSSIPMSEEHPGKNVSVRAPTYGCQPEVNHRKLNPNDVQVKLKLSDSKEYTVGAGEQYRSLLNTALGKDPQLNLASFPYSIIAYEPSQSNTDHAGSNPISVNFGMITNGGTLYSKPNICPLTIQSVLPLLVEFCNINAAELNPCLPQYLDSTKTTEQHLASYYFVLALQKMSTHYKKLKATTSWLRLYLRTIKIAKGRLQLSVKFDSYFSDRALLDNLLPISITELRHKVLFLFSRVLYPTIKNAMIDGKGRIQSLTHAMIAMPFPDENQTYADYEIPNREKSFPVVDELSVLKSLGIVHLYSLGMPHCNGKFQKILVRESQIIQNRMNTSRGQSFQDWVNSSISSLLSLHTKQQDRSKKILERFIGPYRNFQDRNKLLVNDLSFDSLPLHARQSLQEKVIIPVTNSNRILKNSKKRKRDQAETSDSPLAPTLQPVFIEGLADNWIEYSKDFTTKNETNKPGTSEKRRDHRDASLQPLPYLAEYPFLPKSCPGFTYNEWLGYIQPLMVFLITRSFSSDSLYCLEQMREGEKDSEVATNKYYHAVVLTNKFVAEFEQSKGNTQPTQAVYHYMRLFRMIAMATISNCNLELHEDPCPGLIEGMKQVSILLTNWGSGSFHPMTVDNSIISSDGYVICPLEVAQRRERDYEPFKVR
jgi:hypothetical protein